jgi:hypothetical protein
MRVEYNINKVQDTSYPLAQYGLLDVYSPVAPGLTRGAGKAGPEADRWGQGKGKKGKMVVQLPNSKTSTSWAPKISKHLL